MDVIENENECLDIQHFKLPENKNQLQDAETIIGDLKFEVDEMKKNDTIDDISHDEYYERVAKVLLVVGELSMPAFRIFDDLERMYYMRYRAAPKLATRLWLEHYDKLHHPYSLLKNRCHTLLENLDSIYIKKYKKVPMNWNI